MFEFLFKFSPSVFAKGEFVFLGRWPLWVLALLAAAGCAALGLYLWRKRAHANPSLTPPRLAALWLLQCATLALILALLWQPAILISALRPQQNIVAVVFDDSRSMSIVENGTSRIESVLNGFRGRVLDDLQKRFQVRMYRMSGSLERIETVDVLRADAPATRIGDSLRQLASESSGLPLGAVILATDGADNAGGIDLETISELRNRRIPVHTVAFGRERPARDIEIHDVQIPARALADSRLSAYVTLTQFGYKGETARLTLRESGKILASKEITLAADGAQQVETLLFNAGTAGAKVIEASVSVLANEENPANNQVSRLLNVSAAKPRILYIEGEPRWEFKWIRRAVEEDRNVHLVTMLRTSQNKIYRQGIENPSELEHGFPARIDEMFAYEGLIIGSVDLPYFTAAQQELIRQFADRRGGGVLFLAGRDALSEGGWAQSSLAEILPVTLPTRTGTFQRDPAQVELTQPGMESLICRIDEDAAKNAERWKKLPHLANYQDVGHPKPGALVLAEFSPGGRGKYPFLVTQNYGRGRTAVLATAGTWRWHMHLPLEDKSHATFWTQLLRWLVSDTPGRVTASTPRQLLADEGRLVLTAEVRDKSYLPAPDAQVEARILGPEGIADLIELQPDPHTPGVYAAEWNAVKPGTYVAEIVSFRGEEELGRDVLTFLRQNGVAENFRTSMNRTLLERLSHQTGGRFWTPGDLSKLTDEISYSEAGLTVRETKDLWDMPVVFLVLLLLRGAEWILRRRWGVV